MNMHNSNNNGQVIELVEKYGELFWEQLELESSYKKYAMDNYRVNCDKKKEEGAASSLTVGISLINHQFETVYNNVKTFVDHTLSSKKAGVKPAYLGILQDIKEVYNGKEDDMYHLLSYLPFSILLNGVFRKEMRLSNLAQMIGLELYQEVEMQMFMHINEKKLNKAILKGISERNKRNYKTYYAQRMMQHAKFQWNKNWSDDDRKHLGAKLIELVMDGSGYFEQYHSVTAFKGDGVTEIRPTQWLLDTWEANEENVIAKAYKLIPSIIPPAPWEDYKTGGYHGELRNHTTMLRLNDLKMSGSNNVFSKDYMARLNQLEMKEVKASINAIQETAWTINKEVLKVLEQIIRVGGEIGGVARQEPIEKMARLPETATEEELKKHKEKAVELIHKEAQRKSRATRVRGHIAIAKELSKYDHIYFPCNMDFRGRVYPIPSFSFQGDDINKALIKFADAPPLEDEDDVFWFNVHGANLAGVDKVSYADRIAWVKKNHHNIIESAADPLGYRWWSDVAIKDYPMQLLAWCFEYVKLQDHIQHTGTPKGFITGVCVALDGTCSGLQHFSAILRDPIGAKAVNLLPTDKPQDIYAMVADKVNVVLKHDAQHGTPDETKTNEETGKTYIAFGTKSLAQQWLTFGVNRTVTKRSVMTLAYGSKQYGFKEQIYEDTIKPAADDGDKTFPNKFSAAGYLAKLIWDAVNTTVVKAVEGMAWLQKMARLVTKEGRVVTWVTPMGLPVQQSYMIPENEVFRLRFGGTVKRLYSYKMTGDIDKKAQCSGIAPNFIHSMDAAHLQLTVYMGKQEGINHFAMIHDSYGTTVAQTKVMTKVVREAFIKMYEENDVLENFKDDMEVFIDKSDKIPAIPSKGNLELSVIREALYTFA